jgi:hypothetical protein
MTSGMPKTHTVVQGDCLEKIAHQYGFFPETIWNHPDNVKLRELRDPAVLLLGDVVAIPDLRDKTVSVAAGQRHRFVRRGVSSRFRVTLDFGERSPANLKYLLDIDDGSVLYQGTLDSSGRIDHWIPPASGHAKLTVGEEVFEFDLGHLDPVEERQGIVERLRGLGYLEDGGEVSDKRLTGALRQFQQDNKLEPTGKPDDHTCASLVEKFGC